MVLVISDSLSKLNFRQCLRIDARGRVIAVPVEDAGWVLRGPGSRAFGAASETMLEFVVTIHRTTAFWVQAGGVDLSVDSGVRRPRSHSRDVDGGQVRRLNEGGGASERDGKRV